MQTSIEEKLNPDQVSDSETKICQEFFRFLNFNISADDDVNRGGTEATDNRGDDDDDEEEEEEEFSFVCGEASTSPIAAEDAFINGQIKPIFPLFNRDLLLSTEDLSFKPPVEKVFVETNEQNSQTTSPTPESDEIVGPYCAWTSGKAVAVGSPEMCKKSNSTGFSKIWRFKEFMGRSNSDGRDAFVFLNNSNAPPSGLEVKKPSKSKKASVSAHEVYLKSKAKEEGGRRRSYLPYRPELMGFFTNAKGGLTKNVHPF